jgi:hypothetical protein
MENNDCPYEEKVYRIKYGLLNQIFYAGSRWRMERLVDEQNGRKNDEKSYESANAIISSYCDVVDLVWEELSEESECDDDSSIVEDIEKDLKKNTKE